MHLIKRIPSRTAYALATLLTSAWATSWQRPYRQTFWLADGHRDTHRIALLLRKPEPLITRVVEELTVAGYLSLQTESKVIGMNSALLKASFELIVPQKEAFAHSFYQRLFSDYPQTQPLFAHTKMKRQEGSLLATLATVVAAVERGDNLVPTLQSLGDRHQRHGVQAEHYPLVGAVLLETFYEYLGPAFTPAMQEAWEQAFELISAQMLRGGEPVALPESSDETVLAE